MSGFAEIKLIDDISHIPVKFNILRKAPGFMVDWYIRKFNPFTAEDMEIIGERGFLVTIPLTAHDMCERPEYFNEQVEKTLYSLRDYGVGIVLPPVPTAGILTDQAFPDVLPIADGKGVFVFFMMQAIEKTLKLARKNIKTAEIMIMDGDDRLTMTLLDAIYPYVNYLTLITNSDIRYVGKCTQIYSDCGLNINMSSYNRFGLESADIIINMREENKFDYYYKRGAIYFELAYQNGTEIAAKRDDILIVDGLLLGCNAGTPCEEDISLERFECGLHAMSHEYRKLKSRYDSRSVRAVSERIKTLGYSVRGLKFCGRLLSRADFTNTFRQLNIR